MRETASRVRKHELPGLHNFRDTGGYAARTGSTRWGKLFRSDALHQIDQHGQKTLGELGISSVVDLRGEQERIKAPSRLDTTQITVHPLPVFDEAAPTAQLAATASIEHVYDYMIDHRAEAITRAIQVIAESKPDEGVLVHCAAGKDRTGLVIALTLIAVGVTRELVIADYAASETNLAGAWADAMLAAHAVQGRQNTPELTALITASPPDALERQLERIETRHGTVERYLLEHGLSDTQLDRLYTNLIDTTTATADTTKEAS